MEEANSIHKSTTGFEFLATPNVKSEIYQEQSCAAKSYQND